MNMKFSSVFVVMVSSSLLAQQASNSPPAASLGSAAPANEAPSQVSSPTNNQPVVKSPSQSKSKRSNEAPEPSSTPLMPGPAVVKVSPFSRVMVRGRAGLRGEIIGRMTNGEPVTVIEEVDLKHSGPDEPSAWAKIELPMKVHPWVHSSYVDPSSKTVTATTLNVRGGPGENYSVLGTLHKGETVQEIGSKGVWIQIEAPTNAYAFMAAPYLTQEAPALAVATQETTAEPVTTEPLPTPETVAKEPAIATAPTNTPAVPEMAAGTNEVAAATTGEETQETPAVAEPPPPHIVQREGYVRSTFSIQAPTPFELISPDTHRIINYLYTTSTNLDLSRYKGLHIVVTGEEGLDERWRNTPVILIRRIQVLD